VLELRAIEQHHARGPAGLLLPAGAAAREDRLAAHVAREQLVDVADGEDVGIDHQRAALVAHQLGRQEAQRRERLQVVVGPHAPIAVAQIAPTLVIAEERVVLLLDDLHVEGVGVARVAVQRVLRDERADHLLVVAVDEDTGLHDVHPLSP
jgi:hypothetical protein